MSNLIEIHIQCGRGSGLLSQGNIALRGIGHCASRSHNTVDILQVREDAHLLAAWRLSDTPGSKPLNRSILQHYVLSIKAITAGVMAKVRAERVDQIRLAERTFADEFCRTLGNRADKPKAIREASTRLQEIGLNNMIPSFITTADVIGIDAADKDRAIDLYKLRSNSLSHPGKRSDHQIQQWLQAGGLQISLPDALAREFLVKYCAHSSKGADKVRLPAPYFAAAVRPTV